MDLARPTLVSRRLTVVYFLEDGRAPQQADSREVATCVQQLVYQPLTERRLHRRPKPRSTVIRILARDVTYPPR